jgi:hypothetical protein
MTEKSVQTIHFTAMAPTRTKKQKSSDSSGYEAGPENAIDQSAPAMQSQPRAATPELSPTKRPVIITQAQKQALIDNLQLESKCTS